MPWWTQNYDPFGSWVISTAVAALPVLVLLGLLGSGRANAWQSALFGLVTALIAAIWPFQMPIPLALAAAGYGVVFALFRIVWLIVAAVFLYDIAVATGEFEVMKRSIAQLSGDRRIQAVLVAFSFGAFIEGAAGFGAPVAISAAFLVGLGFDAFQAALLCLIANTAPVAWGAIGTPIRTLAGVTGLDVEAISATSGRILPIMSLIIPFWLVATLSGLRATLAVWPALLVVGGAFAGAQFLWSNGEVLFQWGFTSFELVDIVSAVASLLAGVVLMRFWRPRDEWRFAHDETLDDPSRAALREPRLKRQQVARAWTPFALLTVMVLIWGIPRVKDWMAGKQPWPGGLGTLALDWKPAMPLLHLAVAKGEAVSGHPPTEKDLEKAELDIVPVSSTGTAVFLAALGSAVFLGVPPRRLLGLFLKTIRRLVPAITAILCMLSLGFVTKYAGMDAVLGLAFTRTGPLLYPIFGTLLGWLGVALTGSDTASNVLFGNLQKITATKLRLDPILMASANTTGGVMGKMIDAQSIVVAAAATGESGQEGRLLRAVLVHSLTLALLVGLIVWIYAHVWPTMVVSPATTPTP